MRWNFTLLGYFTLENIYVINLRQTRLVEHAE